MQELGQLYIAQGCVEVGGILVQDFQWVKHWSQSEAVVVEKEPPESV
jgi:hypothetical protein